MLAKPREFFRIVKSLIGKKSYQYLSLFIVSLLLSALELLSIGIIYPFISFITGNKGGLDEIAPLIAQFLIPIMENTSLIMISVVVLIIFLAKGSVKFLLEYYNIKTTQSLRALWMTQLFSKYITFNYKFYIQKKQGSFIYNLFDLPFQTLMGLRFLVGVFLHGVTTLIVLIGLLYISWKITSIFIVFSIIGAYFFYKPATLKAINLGKSRLKYFKDIHNQSAEIYKGIREIKANSIENKIMREFNQSIYRMTTIITKENFYKLIPVSLPEIIVISFLSLSIIILSELSHIDLASIFPLIAMYTFASYRLFGNGSNCIKMIISMYNEWPSVRSLFEELHNPSYVEKHFGSKKVPRSNNSIIFKDVKFSYEKYTTKIFNFSTRFDVSQYTAIVGASGSGKSTIANLLIRLYQPPNGKILYGEDDISTFNIKDWRNQIGFVSQDPFLFNGSIKENILIGTSNDIPMEDIVHAATMADAHKFIIETPAGYDTLIGEKGARLSGGQRQRITIARALLKKPRILILDEATSALDYESEEKIMSIFEELKRDRIFIVIAHRLSSVVIADKIIVLKDGRVVEVGRHEDLINRNEEYYRLYQKSVQQ